MVTTGIYFVEGMVTSFGPHVALHPWQLGILWGVLECRQCQVRRLYQSLCAKELHLQDGTPPKEIHSLRRLARALAWGRQSPGYHVCKYHLQVVFNAAFYADDHDFVTPKSKSSDFIFPHSTFWEMAQTDEYCMDYEYRYDFIEDDTDSSGVFDYEDNTPDETNSNNSVNEFNGFCNATIVIEANLCKKNGITSPGKEVIVEKNPDVPRPNGLTIIHLENSPSKRKNGFKDFEVDPVGTPSVPKPKNGVMDSVQPLKSCLKVVGCVTLSVVGFPRSVCNSLLRANRRWRRYYPDDVLDFSATRKVFSSRVRFNCAAPEVHVLRQYSTASRLQRRGNWTRDARDRIRFEKRIKCIEGILMPVLRKKIEAMAEDMTD